MGFPFSGNLIFHATKLGNNQEEIFRKDEDRQEYLKLLCRYRDRLRFRIYGYVLLPDHIHLLLGLGPVGLSRVMHAVHSAYARYYNKEYQRRGHLFQGRYTAAPCTGPRHFWELLRWLHFHPIRTGLAQKTEEYPWSSHQEYLGRATAGVTDQGEILAKLFPGEVVGRQVYREIMEWGLDILPRGWKQVAAAWETGLGPQRREKPGSSLAQLIYLVCQKTGTEPSQLGGSSRRAPVVWARSLTAYIALRLGTWTAAEVARALDKHPATILRGAERVERELDKKTAGLVTTIWRQVKEGGGPELTLLR